ncbi:MAG: hypothetical protein LJE84_12310 [Gammaproteobacteria bacterium]|nr:hypothetical protein [Gammaproteobacteria bacterium]
MNMLSSRRRAHAFRATRRIRTLALACATAWLSGCSGVAITQISPESARHTGAETPGYIVHAPMVVVEIAEVEVCAQRNDSNKCVRTTTRCSVGKPFVLPDYQRPFRVNVKSGLGKTNVDLTFNDGWLLGKVKDASDNSGIPASLLKVLEGVRSLAEAKARVGGCKPAGLYRVGPDSTSLQELKLY